MPLRVRFRVGIAREGASARECCVPRRHVRSCL